MLSRDGQYRQIFARETRVILREAAHLLEVILENTLHLCAQSDEDVSQA